MRSIDQTLSTARACGPCTVRPYNSLVDLPRVDCRRSRVCVRRVVRAAWGGSRAAQARCSRASYGRATTLASLCGPETLVLHGYKSRREGVGQLFFEEIKQQGFTTEALDLPTSVLGWPDGWADGISLYQHRLGLG